MTKANRILVAACLSLTSLLASHAQPSTSAAAPAANATGVITGRIFNPNTGEYVRNAQVRIQETGQTAISEGGGEFRLAPVPAGKATLVVTYTGYQTATAAVTVGAGATATQDFNLVSGLEGAGTAGETIKLSQFVVSSAREGSAKAIMEQRNSMNVTNTVASDSFGDNAEGNIGEFLRHLPGVELDLFYGEVRNVRLGGLGSEYTSVTMDGISLASADANAGAAGNARAFTMEMASLNSMESIEVSKTISADVDANAPAGTINLRTKRAFDRAGRRVTLQANVTAHSEEFNFNNSRGPDEDGTSLKIRPGGIFEYSDVFLNKRLGVVLNISESNVYQETLISSMTVNGAPTAADPRPAVITALNFQHAPRFNKRFAVTLTTDYKVSPQLSVGLGLVYNYADLWTPQRTVIFNTGARNTVVGADPLLSFRTSATNANVVANPVAVSKLGETVTVLPKFEYKRGSFGLEGKFAYSDATSWYDPLTRRSSVRDVNSPTANGVTFEATRSSAESVDWQFTQLAGPDISSGASFTNPPVSTNDGRFSRSLLYSGEVIGSAKTTSFVPIAWKSGLKSRMELRKFEDDQTSRRYDYIGAGTGTTGGYAAFRSPWEYDFDTNHGSITSVSGGNVFMPDLRRLGALWQERPSDFRQNWGADSINFYETNVARRRRYDERIDAAFLMGTTSTRRYTLRAGVRWEETSTDATETNPRTPAEVRQAGFTVNAAGRATTIPGLDYQYLSRPRVHRKGNYDNLFPSASFKYRISDSFDFHFGFSSTIRRPTYANLAGVWAINETNLTVTAPNPNLRPETSENYAARLAYYFEPVGQLAITFTQKNVKDLFITDRLTSEEFGYSGQDDLSNYEFVTTENGTEKIKIRGMELEYNQSLSFLGELFRRLSIRGAYTRIYAEIPRANMTPHIASAGLNYSLNRLYVYTNWNWLDDVNTNVAGTTYRRHRSNLDLGGNWRLTNTYSLSLSARNVLNAPYINKQRFASGVTAMTRHEITGVSYTFAIKATY